MQRIAKFHKVSFEQFKKDWADTFPDMPEEEIIHIYEGIRLPARATSGSAGYDFFTPVPLTLAPGESMKVPTGVTESRKQATQNIVISRILDGMPAEKIAEDYEVSLDYVEQLAHQLKLSLIHI